MATTSFTKTSEKDLARISCLVYKISMKTKGNQMEESFNLYYVTKAYDEVEVLIEITSHVQGKWVYWSDTGDEFMVSKNQNLRLSRQFRPQRVRLSPCQQKMLTMFLRKPTTNIGRVGDERRELQTPHA